MDSKNSTLACVKHALDVSLPPIRINNDMPGWWHQRMIAFSFFARKDSCSSAATYIALLQVFQLFLVKWRHHHHPVQQPAFTLFLTQSHFLTISSTSLSLLSLCCSCTVFWQFLLPPLASLFKVKSSSKIRQREAMKIIIVVARPVYIFGVLTTTTTWLNGDC